MMDLRDSEPLDRVRGVLDIWEHNRKLYPGWLVFPSGEERTALSRRTDEWEMPILIALRDSHPVDTLKALRELVWRRGILLEPISIDLEGAANEVLNQIDCEMHTIEGAHARRDDWAEIREAWTEVALTLITDARLDCDSSLFEERVGALRPLAQDSPDVEHRIHQEHCLWALYSLDFDRLNDLLNGWTVENCDPVWMLRKAALLTEAYRYDDSVPLVQTALSVLRQNPEESRSIASASREGWALASTLTVDNRQNIFREWSRLASLKCDAAAETERLRRSMSRSNEQDEAPSFDLGVRQGTRVRFSNLGRFRLLAAYRAIRLLEMVGVPPVNNPGRDSGMPMSLVSGLLALAADELVATDPKLAMRLVLRVCNYDKDKTLQRVLSRSHVARLTDDDAGELARLCIGMIEHALPLLFVSEVAIGHISWVERLRVALEVLSRLTLRLPLHMVRRTLDLGLECYRTDRVAQHSWLGDPLGNLLERAWEALPKNDRANRSLELLTAPMAGLDNFPANANCPDPGRLIGADDLPSNVPLVTRGSTRMWSVSCCEACSVAPRHVGEPYSGWYHW